MSHYIIRSDSGLFVSKHVISDTEEGLEWVPERYNAKLFASVAEAEAATLTSIWPTKVIAESFHNYIYHDLRNASVGDTKLIIKRNGSRGNSYKLFPPVTVTAVTSKSVQFSDGTKYTHAGNPWGVSRDYRFGVYAETATTVKAAHLERFKLLYQDYIKERQDTHRRQTLWSEISKLVHPHSPPSYVSTDDLGRILELLADKTPQS